ncbi:MAG: hypothetical protein ABSE16_13500 [Verrucomicrobiota bacterium]
MRYSCIVVFTVLTMLAAHAQTGGDNSPGYAVNAKDIGVKLSVNGEIAGLTAGGREINATGGTSLAGCTQVGETKVEKLSGGAVEFTRTLQQTGSGRTVTLVDRFKAENDSVRWEIEVASDGDPWTADITTALNYPATAATRFWTAWSDPVWTNWFDTDIQTGEWRDPLVLRPLIDAAWTYGDWNTSASHTVLPLVTIAEPADDFGLSLVVSPEDTILCGSTFKTTPSGAIGFTRTNYRLGGGKRLHFEMNLVAHEADWRGGLRWLTMQYPEFFQPPNRRADEMAGCAAYSGDEEPVDVAHLKKMGFRVNWKLDDDMAYMGMYIPPVTNADEQWERSWRLEAETPDKPHMTSARTMNHYAEYLKTNGFYCLDYFNVYNFGGRRGATNGPLWQNGHAFMLANFPHAPVTSRRGLYDCGDPDFEKFLLEQGDADIRWMPDSAGICIDNTYFSLNNNTNADDGVSWINGGPARAMCLSWDDLFSKLGPKMHNAGKVIFASPLFARLDVYRQIDGFYDEFGYDGRGLNSSAFMGLEKPVLAWSYNDSLFRPNPDTFFQRHLLMGAYPTAPYPWNNHCIIPDMNWDRFYFDFGSLFERDTGHKWMKPDQYYVAYGPLLDAMRGKKWVLAPHCVEVVNDTAKVNLFEVPSGYAMPVCFGGNATYADVIIRNIPSLGSYKYSVIQPGVETPASATILFKDRDGATMLRVPLVQGCAMVTLQK